MHKLWEKQLSTPVTEEEWLGVRSLSYRICDGYVSNAVRAQARRAALAERMNCYLNGDTVREVPNVADSVISRDVTVRVLQQLQGRDRKVLALLLMDYKVPEIAAELNCSPATARTGVERVRVALRRVVELGEPGRASLVTVPRARARLPDEEGSRRWPPAPRWPG